LYDGDEEGREGRWSESKFDSYAASSHGRAGEAIRERVRRIVFG
jgi:hypothetical protein